MDNVLSEKQMRLLTMPLYMSWRPGRPFVAMANVGLFAVPKNPAIVPDVLVSLDVEPQLTGPDGIKSYFVWELGKVPDVVIEIVSNTKGGELSDKLRAYERIHVPHYVVFDPSRHLGPQELTIFSMDGGIYTERPSPRFASLGLELTRWDGVIEGYRLRWLRWADLDGHLLRSPEESENERQAEKARADEEKARADEEKARADEERAHAKEEKARADDLAEQLRALGVEPRR